MEILSWEVQKRIYMTHNIQYLRHREYSPFPLWRTTG